MIPKVIWQTHKYEENKLPEHLKLHINDWKKLNPDFEYKYINDEQATEMMEQYSYKYGDIVKDFWHNKNVPSAFKCDLWRYITIYENGGFYFDIDTQPAMPIPYDKIKDLHAAVQTSFSNDNNNNEKMTNNAAFGFEKNSPILNTLINTHIFLMKLTFEKTGKYFINTGWPIGAGLYSEVIKFYVNFLTFENKQNWLLDSKIILTPINDFQYIIKPIFFEWEDDITKNSSYEYYIDYLRKNKEDMWVYFYHGNKFKTRHYLLKQDQHGVFSEIGDKYVEGSF
jgi:hypothetical protein